VKPAWFSELSKTMYDYAWFSIFRVSKKKNGPVKYLVNCIKRTTKVDGIANDGEGVDNRVHALRSVPFL